MHFLFGDSAGEEAGTIRDGGRMIVLMPIQRAYALAQSHPRVSIQWIKAHDGSRWNEYADALATTYLRKG